MTYAKSIQPDIKADLRPGLADIRDQGTRPLCLAFSVSDLHSHERKMGEHLSVEYLAYYAYKHSGNSNGLTTNSLIYAIKEHGQPREKDCPYSASTQEPKEPPKSCGQIFKADCRKHQLTTEQIRQNLDSSKAVVIIIDLPATFYVPNQAHIIDDDENIVGTHAVLAVGYGVSDDSSHHLLIRNSWGLKWGNNGHAWLTEKLVRSRLKCCLNLKKV